MEGRNMAIADIPGDFLQTDMVHGNRTVHVRICGVSADFLVNIDPANVADRVVLEGGQKVIHVALKNSLDGDLIASLLF